MEQKYGLRCCNVFHAGDGNLHPLILFDANDPDQLHRCELFGADILETSVAMGGTVTGEHGVGVEKLSSMCVQFSPAEREQMFAVKRAFDPPKRSTPARSSLHAAALRRIRKDACEEGPAALPRTGALLMDTALAQLLDHVQAARAARAALNICGGGTKAFYGGPAAGHAAGCEGAARHQQLRAERAGGDGARRHAAGRAGSGAGREGPVPAVRAARAGWRRGWQCGGNDGGTVGGMVAAGLAGPARAAVGGVRDYVLGATLLTGRAKC
jgi:FAD/FMN-containing dehydrogenase